MSKCYQEAMKIEKAIKGKYNYVSFSGGKDSTAMLLKLLENGVKIDKVIFADTGFEFPELYQYLDRIDKVLEEYNLKIERLDPSDLWSKWFYGFSTRGNSKGKIRGYPLRFYPCYYTREAKVKPLQKAMVKAKNIYIGIAYDEKHRCSDDDFIKYPLVEWKWTEQDCVDYLNKKGLLNPLYKNFNRLGCFHCQKQNIGSLYVLWKLYPDLWEKSKMWDEASIRVSNHGMKEKPLSWYEKEFKNGFVPKKLPKYECVGCDGVANAFNIRQEKLMEYVKK